ncbi:hypothetical protein O9G_003051 [Rozella allomycis CSF55]|uniref:SUN domain-containing protein n=1 Tax=Rozella allomycis (strain CSF55) TaxID=988480 RepID=A0A075AMH7_ROZAC|nr:hypothetical protein O9G_003051 [Rozella allomycis CSF55]|eukprot:EPZ30816.1 hypothetical protein O9G_003051 [Rozella allomycis CSF55]
MKKIIQNLVKELMEKYTKDSIGHFDYALASTGTKIVRSLTTSDYHSPNNFVSRWFNLGIKGKPPITALTPDVSFGNCWSFHNDKGVLTIALGKSTIPTDFTIDHISQNLTLDISSAPKNISVYGFNKESDKVLLSSFIFDPHLNPTQSFPASVTSFLH